MAAGASSRRGARTRQTWRTAAAGPRCPAVAGAGRRLPHLEGADRRLPCLAGAGHLPGRLPWAAHPPPRTRRRISCRRAHCLRVAVNHSNELFVVFHAPANSFSGPWCAPVICCKAP
eukprot:432732-Prymnesium_polylepis.1